MSANAGTRCGKGVELPFAEPLAGGLDSVAQDAPCGAAAPGFNDASTASLFVRLRDTDARDPCGTRERFVSCGKGELAAQR